MGYTYPIYSLYIKPYGKDMNKFTNRELHKVRNTDAPPKLRYLENLRQFADHIAKVNDWVLVPMSNFVHAMIFPSGADKSPITVFIDSISGTPFYVSDPSRMKQSVELYNLNSVIFEEDMNTVGKALDKIANRILPNLSHSVTDELFDLVLSAATGREYDLGSANLTKTINRAATESEVIFSNEWRITDKLSKEIKDIFKQYRIQEPFPTDLSYNTEKSWVYHGTHKDDNLDIPVLVVLNHVRRNCCPSIDLVVSNPLYNRRGFDYRQIK